MRLAKAVLPLALASAGSMCALAAGAQEGGYYFGGLAVGQARARLDEQRTAGAELPAGVRSSLVATDVRDAAYKMSGGYRFDRNLAVEGGYSELGRFSFASATPSAGLLDGEVRLEGVSFDVIGALALSRRIAALARVGAQYARAIDRFSGSGATGVSNPVPSAREINYKLGAGLQYAVSPRLLLRVEAERYRINDAVSSHRRVDVYSVSLVFPLGSGALLPAAVARKQALRARTAPLEPAAP